jgi:chromosome segregation ATPase
MLKTAKVGLDEAVSRMVEAQTREQTCKQELADARFALREAMMSCAQLQKQLREAKPQKDELEQQLKTLQSEVVARRTENSVLRDELMPLHGALRVVETLTQQVAELKLLLAAQGKEEEFGREKATMKSKKIVTENVKPPVVAIPPASTTPSSSGPKGKKKAK